MWMDVSPLPTPFAFSASIQVPAVWRRLGSPKAGRSGMCFYKWAASVMNVLLSQDQDPAAAARTEKQSPRDSQPTSIIAFFCTLAECAQMCCTVLLKGFIFLFKRTALQHRSFQNSVKMYQVKISTLRTLSAAAMHQCEEHETTCTNTRLSWPWKEVKKLVLGQKPDFVRFCRLIHVLPSLYRCWRCSLSQLQSWKGAGCLHFQAFIKTFGCLGLWTQTTRVYVVFIAFPRECFSLTLLLLYSKKTNETQLLFVIVVYTVYQRIHNTFNNYCKETWLPSINLFLIHACVALRVFTEA